MRDTFTYFTNICSGSSILESILDFFVKRWPNVLSTHVHIAQAMRVDMRVDEPLACHKNIISFQEKIVRR